MTSPSVGRGDGDSCRTVHPPGVEALYLGLGILTAVNRANPGFVSKIPSCMQGADEVQCDYNANLWTDAVVAAPGLRWEDIACPWHLSMLDGNELPCCGIVWASAGLTGCLQRKIAGR
jgi:hypothetical protein